MSLFEQPWNPAVAWGFPGPPCLMTLQWEHVVTMQGTWSDYQCWLIFLDCIAHFFWCTWEIEVESVEGQWVDLGWFHRSICPSNSENQRIRDSHRGDGSKPINNSFFLDNFLNHKLSVTIVLLEYVGYLTIDDDQSSGRIIRIISGSRHMANDHGFEEGNDPWSPWSIPMKSHDEFQHKKDTS